MICALFRHCPRPRLLIFLAGTFLVSRGGVAILPVQAQPVLESLPPLEVPPPPLPNPVETPAPLPALPEFQPTPKPVPAEELPPAPANAIPDTITVERFAFAGNTAFSDQELAAVTASFINRPLTFTELLQARSAVTKFYVDRGYVTSGAYLPPQAIEGGVVAIQVVEGSLEAIEVEVKGKLRPDYVRDRLALATGAPLNAPRLLEALQLLQLNPLIEKISANLSASPHPGSSLLKVTVQTAASFDAEAILDNGRSPQVGSFRRGVQLGERNLTGFGDSLQATYLNSDGSNDLNVAYTLPVNPHNGTVGLRFRTVTSQIVESPLNAADIISDYQQYELSLRQPIWQTPEQEFALGLTFDRQSSQSFLGLLPDSPYLVTSGTDGRGRTVVSSLGFSQEWLTRSDRQVFALRSEFNWGLDTLGATDSFDASVNPFALDSSFFLWRGQLQWVNLLAPDTLLVARSDLQLADRAIVPLERFALGGLGSVRGYRQNTLLTDNGVFASLELRLPIYRHPPQDMVLQVVPFVDLGMGWNSAAQFNPDTNTLASVGIGLNWQAGKNLNVRLDWGIPLGRVPFEGDTLQDQGLLFTVIFKN